MCEYNIKMDHRGTLCDDVASCYFGQNKDQLRDRVTVVMKFQAPCGSENPVERSDTLPNSHKRAALKIPKAGD
jgi:hypothetical protein